MYTRKPKNITKYLVGITAAQAFHTWQYADDQRSKQMGSSAQPLSVQQRKRRELNRKTIRAYRDSKVASIATHAKGDVSKFTANERAKLTKRLEKKETLQSRESLQKPTPPTLKERPMPDASLYRRPYF